MMVVLMVVSWAEKLGELMEFQRELVTAEMREKNLVGS